MPRRVTLNSELTAANSAVIPSRLSARKRLFPHCRPEITVSPAWKRMSALNEKNCPIC